MHRGFHIGLCTLVLAIAISSIASAADVKVPEAGQAGWVSLFDGKSLDGWHARSENRENFWKAADGELHNTGTGSDLISDVKLGDHELFVQFKSPRGGNSGVYLQGRYEVQVGDTAGRDVGKHICGAIYSQIAPTINAALPIPEGENETPWQTFHIKFRSAERGAKGNIVEPARITVVHNGLLTIDNRPLEGPTGSAVDGDEGVAAGLMLQGDHTKMKYRNILYRPMPEE